ncbi:hypothetical protein HRR83_001325 [Exophiala dermatitidis]|uniref:Uncharacterized protein n=2 Tax=Exophiala dermatitidis TaxID=5970 RepID=H6C6Q3_EXODN|nr:uncharacterized protein HMPREF1120_07389 [Exophiala dermatitidis NIH/UT8656]KAJ4526136.1 hypothetical protein HRR74_001329 [Exophiala dermatitidis]EHY59399.1 hypothetical protein HMPREF1120_07389 [Exophiala dermatitidis NIH/UT8656]KAJ4526919.1 hypothetical protein HRR73_001716 [Exophiala dermatitidis]KAJ4532632.1 hypothetical protein HRR76_007618 [Exophiala dermatitidis]KAJ4546856.1 hypothetical protein HRR77_004399 [Exophiala dermatitidis]
MNPLSSHHGLYARLGRDITLRASKSRGISSPFHPRRCQHSDSRSSHLPRLAQPSIWHSIVPKSLRDRFFASGRRGKKKPTNPASYFIWIYLLIGSQAIRIMGLKNDFANYTRQADLKLEKLREVVQKLQRGEEVDVEKVLGTGDEIQEQEWEEALRQLQEEDRIWQSNAKKRREEQERMLREQQDADPVNASAKTSPEAAGQTPEAKPYTPTSPGFY